MILFTQICVHIRKFTVPSIILTITLFHSGVIVAARAWQWQQNEGRFEEEESKASWQQPMPCNSKGAKARSKHRMKRKDNNSEVTKPCHLGARWRLQHLAFVHKLLKSMLSSMSQHASVFSHRPRLYYAPYTHDQGLLCTACVHLEGSMNCILKLAVNLPLVLPSQLLWQS